MKNQILIILAILLTSCCSNKNCTKEIEELQSLNKSLYKNLKHEFREHHLTKTKQSLPYLFLGLYPSGKNRLSFHLLDFNRPFPHDVEKMVMEDIKSKNINILTGGLSWYNKDIKIFLSTNYDIEVLDISGCRSPQVLFDFIDAYNKISIKAIELTTGKSYKDICKEAEDASQKS